jgi:hypothetical protein
LVYCSGFRVLGFVKTLLTGFRVQYVKVKGSGLRFHSSGFRVYGLGCRVQGSAVGIQAQGSGCRVQGLGFVFRVRVQD